MQRIPSNDYVLQPTYLQGRHLQHAQHRQPPPPQRRVTRGATTLLRRAKTLTRPERAVAPVPLINPVAPTSGGSGGGSNSKHSVPGGALGSRGGSSGGNVAVGGNSILGQSRRGIDWWKVSALAFTWWVPNVFLRKVMKLDSPATRQAWREKVAFCCIAILLGGIVGFVTMGLQKTLCPEEASNNAKALRNVGSTASRFKALKKHIESC